MDEQKIKVVAEDIPRQSKGISEESCLLTATGVVPIREITGLHISAANYIFATRPMGGTHMYYRIGVAETQEEGEVVMRRILEQFRAALRLAGDKGWFDLRAEELIPPKF